MTFTGFIVLLVISLVVSAVLHYVLKLYIRRDLQSFVAKVVWSYVGAWLGGPLFGNWFAEVAYGGVAIIPAALGSVAILLVLVDMVKTFNAAKTA